MVLEALRKLDIFHSPSYDIAEPSKVGGALSLTAILFCFFCFFSEIEQFRHGKVKEMVYLENSVGGKEMVSVYLDITITDLTCEHVTLDIQDGHGRYEIDENSKENSDIEKHDTLNGCNFKGLIHVRHMKGNFHFTPRGQHHHPNVAISHKINELRFGDDSSESDDEDMPSLAMHALTREEKSSYQGETHDYLIKLVRTEIYDEGYHSYPYQYTYTHRHFVGHHDGKPLPPRVFFRLDFSPLSIKFTRVHDSIWVFLSRHLALLAGTFAVIKMFYNGAHVAKESKFL